MIRRSSRSGFTLAELAVTIVIVGIAVLPLLQMLSSAKLMAAHTRNTKVARDLGLLTLAQIESGLLRDDIDTGMSGNYAEEGWPDFSFEIAVGDDALPQVRQDGRYDSWAPKPDAQSERDAEEEQSEEPFEKVRVRVAYPKIHEYSNEVTLERWIPWNQVYGEAEGQNASRNARAAKGAAGGAAGAGSAGAGVAQPKGTP
ncbi:MAG: prepilin-type N-terminal cleavage/methylation domain-containing protein [Planctomycetes bacterium]|nr:prepilin-type N-terminal cleavage/methylation domain-containing protein [Planctomycetota bacterium]